jgi:hypothetical protein
VSDPPKPLDHLVRALEELLRAAADGFALWQQHDSPLRAALRGALGRELARWERRAGDDPAAARVRDLFAAVVALVESDEPAAQPRAEGSRPRRAPPRVDPSGDRVGYSRRWPS